MGLRQKERIGGHNKEKKGEKTCNVIGLGRGERSFFYWALSTIIPFLDR